jgi:hypothetical protein
MDVYVETCKVGQQRFCNDGLASYLQRPADPVRRRPGDRRTHQRAAVDLESLASLVVLVVSISKKHCTFCFRRQPVDERVEPVPQIGLQLAQCREHGQWSAGVGHEKDLIGDRHHAFRRYRSACALCDHDIDRNLREVGSNIPQILPVFARLERGKLFARRAVVDRLGAPHRKAVERICTAVLACLRRAAVQPNRSWSPPMQAFDHRRGASFLGRFKINQLLPIPAPVLHLTVVAHKRSSSAPCCVRRERSTP